MRESIDEVNDETRIARSAIPYAFNQTASFVRNMFSQLVLFIGVLLRRTRIHRFALRAALVCLFFFSLVYAKHLRLILEPHGACPTLAP